MDPADWWPVALNGLPFRPRGHSALDKNHRKTVALMIWELFLKFPGRRKYNFWKPRDKEGGRTLKCDLGERLLVS